MIGMNEYDLAFLRGQVDECRHRAEQATTEKDRSMWLEMANGLLLHLPAVGQPTGSARRH
jgi:hypothetical protein